MRRRKPADSVKRAKRIAALESRLEQITERALTFGFSDDCPERLREKFLESLLAFEEGEGVPLFDTLTQEGMELPPEESLRDPEIHDKLWELIRRMALLGAYLHSTDHLSDRELYRHLWAETLREPTVLFPQNAGFALHIDLISSGSEEDICTYLRYYADDDSRARWETDFPSVPVPPKIPRPYDRDRFLPRPGDRARD